MWNRKMAAPDKIEQRHDDTRRQGIVKPLRKQQGGSEATDPEEVHGQGSRRPDVLVRHSPAVV